ncbi:4Fe-4S cluster-binding domain-containing protein, partial [Myxococcota bacterium]|nr:4Fe-4S cluster-binding domain-containing protein [Myxococcota bacterium]
MGTHHRMYTGDAGRFQQEQHHFDLHGFTRNPFLVQWMVWSGCSLACPHCLLPRGSSESFAFDGARRGAFLDSLASRNIGELLLTGGEPLEFPHFTRLLGELAERNIPWSINTAALPSPAVQSAIKAYPPRFAAISLDGPEHYHDHFRGKPGAYRDAMESIGFFACVTGHVAAGTTVTPMNLGHLDELFG